MAKPRVITFKGGEISSSRVYQGSQINDLRGCNTYKISLLASAITHPGNLSFDNLQSLSVTVVTTKLFETELFNRERLYSMFHRRTS